MADSRARLITTAFLLVNVVAVKGAGLSFNFYEQTCPNVEDIVRFGIRPWLVDPSTPAALLRLFFHDCHVQACDASILIDFNAFDANAPPSELASDPNFGIRKKELIGALKSMVEAQCPSQVSCADILVLAAREAVALSGGPRINVPLGRRDSSSPRADLADSMLPPASSGVDDILQLFSKKGMAIEETVAILGAHTLGITHCLNLMDRLYSNDQNKETQRIDPKFEAILKRICPLGSPRTNVSFAVNDPTPTIFDNLYYMNAMRGRGVLRIDAELVKDPRTAPIAQEFAMNRDYFFTAFSSAFVKLSSSSVLVGDEGVIRKRCHTMN